jgi:pimeloyl-ACP methyl ester carboxylesterase
MPIVKSNGINIHYAQRGQGEPLILIMGLGANGSLWEDHVRAYESHYRCIMIDNRGSGMSDKPQGPYTTKMMAEDVLGVMDALQIEKAHISGISMGSAIGQELALMHPTRVRTLTLISSWNRCDAYTIRVFESFRALYAISDPLTFSRMLNLWIYSSKYMNAHLEDFLQQEEATGDNVNRMPVLAFQAQCDACISHDTVGRLADIRVPTLVTVGDRDIFTPLSYSRAIADTIPGAELFVIEETGHTHHWEALMQFNSRTLDFLLAHGDERKEIIE